MPFLALIVAASPHLKALTTVDVGGIQFDWLFYGAACVIIFFRPRALLHSFPKKFVLLCVLSLVGAFMEGMWNLGVKSLISSVYG